MDLYRYKITYVTVNAELQYTKWENVHVLSFTVRKESGDYKHIICSNLGLGGDAGVGSPRAGEAAVRDRGPRPFKSYFNI